jgi:hypothetical protein
LQASVCTETGKIRRVVDIAEAPWRVIGLMALPFINAVNSLNALRTGRTPVEPVQPPPYKPLSTTNADATAADPSMDGVDVEREYRLLLTAVLVRAARPAHATAGCRTHHPIAGRHTRRHGWPHARARRRRPRVACERSHAASITP